MVSFTKIICQFLKIKINKNQHLIISMYYKTKITISIQFNTIKISIKISKVQFKISRSVVNNLFATLFIVDTIDTSQTLEYMNSRYHDLVKAAKEVKETFEQVNFYMLNASIC